MIARRAKAFLRQAAAATLAIFVSLAGADACGMRDACAVANGFYLARAPSGWDGKAALPVLMFFHGYRETANSVMANEDLAARMDRLGVLLIAPNGEGQTWSYPGSPARNRDEFDFVRAALADVEKRFPVDDKRLVASGFSQGGSMVWNLACFMGDRFAGFAPISGAFWRPHPMRCPSGPINMRHVHGTNDHTVPMTGRTLRGGVFRQGDVREGLRLFLDANQCRIEPSAIVDAGLQCEMWHGCGSRREIELCLHPGGHDLDARFVEDAMRWIDRLAKGAQ